MDITPQRVKDLREKTGAGMMDCKNALMAAAGDEEKAIEILRKKGLSRVEKRSGREAKEGLVYTILQPDARSGVLIEVNSETDFVAKTAVFGALVQLLARHMAAAAQIPESPEALLDQTSSEHSGQKLLNAFSDTAAKLGENLVLRRFCRYDLPTAQPGRVEAYIHTGSKLGVMLQLECQKSESAQADEFKTLARDIALHVAAANPLSLARDQISAEIAQKEKEIYRAQLEAEGKKKPPEIMEKIISGKMDKFFAEVCLLEQPFVKAPEKAVKDLLGEVGKKLMDDVQVNRYCRFKIGE